LNHIGFPFIKTDKNRFWDINIVLGGAFTQNANKSSHLLKTSSTAGPVKWHRLLCIGSGIFRKTIMKQPDDKIADALSRCQRIFT
jgi:hypothetical protein